jgi:hypothetical protein
VVVTELRADLGWPDPFFRIFNDQLHRLFS